MTDYQLGDRVEYKVHYTFLGEEIAKYTGTILEIKESPLTFRVSRDKTAMFELRQKDVLGPKDIVSKLSK